jgi:rSAM/selenodomain-associated transferase 1
VNARRVLVIMAKAPRPGHAKTRLLSHLPRERVDALYRCFVEDTVALGRRLEGVELAMMCPLGEREALLALVGGGVEIVTQQGQGLANALTSAFSHFAGAGFGRIVAFDCDSPHLRARLLQSAFEALDTHDTVVGPTLDGGYYLIGAKTPHPGLFDGDRLGTVGAKGALMAQIRQRSLTVWELPASYDVDVADDLARLEADLRAEPERAPRTAALLARWADETAG